MTLVTQRGSTITVCSPKIKTHSALLYLQECNFLDNFYWSQKFLLLELFHHALFLVYYLERWLLGIGRASFPLWDSLADSDTHPWNQSMMMSDEADTFVCVEWFGALPWAAANFLLWQFNTMHFAGWSAYIFTLGGIPSSCSYCFIPEVHRL